MVGVKILISRAGKLLIVGLSLAVSLPLSAALAQAKKPKPSPGKTPPSSGSTLESQTVAKVEPVYPPVAKAAKIDGPVEVEVQIDEAGKVTAARAISGHSLLREATVQAALKWRFKPKTLFGVAVLTFNFVLDNNQSDEKDKPDSAEAYTKRGEYLVEAKRFDEAMADFNEAIRRKPDYAWAHYNLGTVYLNTRIARFDAAEKACSQALKLRSEELRRENKDERDMIYENAMICLGMASAYLEKYDQAIKHFREVAALEPKMADVRFMLASVLNVVGEYDGAIIAMKESLALDPDNFYVHNLLAGVATATNRWKEVADFYKQLLKSNPNHVEVLFYAGTAYHKAGDKQSALDVYQTLKKISIGRAEDLLLQINK